MTGKVNPVPDGYPTISPYFIVRDAHAALRFYKQAFGATEFRVDRNSEGKLTNTEMRVGTSLIMFGESPDVKVASVTMEDLPLVGMYMYVEDVDAVFAQAVAAGATVLNPPEDQPYGDRRADIVDPFGIVWWVASKIEDRSPEEAQRGASAGEPLD